MYSCVGRDSVGAAFTQLCLRYLKDVDTCSSRLKYSMKAPDAKLVGALVACDDGMIVAPCARVHERPNECNDQRPM